MHRHFLPTRPGPLFPELRLRRRASLRLPAHARRRGRCACAASWSTRPTSRAPFPATSPPPFEVADGVRCVPAGEIARIGERPERFVIIGAGKTALDACVGCSSRASRPPAIRWIKPREAWWLNRRFQQPHALLPELYRGAAIQLEAMAQATSVDDLFARLEAEGLFLRVDPGVAPTMFRGAVVSEAELALLRQIEDVVRLGHVRRIERDEIVLDEGRVPTSERTVHVHCAAQGLARRRFAPSSSPGE